MSRPVRPWVVKLGETPRETTIYSPGGERLEHVRSVEIICDAQVGKVEARLVVFPVRVDRADPYRL